MDFPTLVGLMAGTLTTMSFVPQLVKAWRTKSARDLSTAMLVVLSGGLILWILYGLLIDAVPVVLTNLVTLVLALSLVALKRKHG